jgi:hypothetical protein
MKTAIALFESARIVIKSERILKASGIRCKAIPVPHHISSECGMALEVESDDISRIESLLHDSMIDVRFVKNDSSC